LIPNKAEPEAALGTIALSISVLAHVLERLERVQQTT
jgi:hypothetical protein